MKPRWYIRGKFFFIGAIATAAICEQFRLADPLTTLVLGALVGTAVMAVAIKTGIDTDGPADTENSKK